MSYLPIPGYEGYYEVNKLGQVRSIDRIIIGVDGKAYPRKGRLLIPSIMKNIGYLSVSLWKDNKGSTQYVHRLVAQVHIPNPNNLLEVNHIDGVKTNSNVENLEWVTRLGNVQHAINIGLKVYTNRLTKDEFIECLFSVIEGESYLSLTERVPYKVPYLSTKVRQYAKELNLEAELDESIYLQRVMRARENGAKNTRKN